jgi:phosphatidylglycerophosphate synthase
VAAQASLLYRCSSEQLLDLLRQARSIFNIHKTMVEECIILAESPAALVELCGISILERLLRTLQRCGVIRAFILSSTADEIARDVTTCPSRAREQIDITVRNREPGGATVEQIVDLSPKSAQCLLVVRGDVVLDARLLQLLSNQSGTVALVDSAVPPQVEPLVASARTTSRGKFCGAVLIRREWLSAQSGLFEDALLSGLEKRAVVALDVADQPLYSRPIRRDLRPLWFPAPSPSGKRLAKRLLLHSVQKGAQDLPALVHAPIENFLVSHLCKTAITPNQLTVFSNIVAWGATSLFLTGHLAWGTALALVVGVLDGLDGKQARVKVETSKAGKLEHWLDALFEWSWWTALAYHFQKTGQLVTAFRYLLVLICAEAVAGLAKGSVVRFRGRSIDELGYFNRAVRLVGGRRNIYIWILALGILLGAPAQAFVLIAWWGAVTAAVQVPSAAFALWARRK